MKEISEMNTAYIELSVANTKAAAYVLADQLELKQFKIMDEHTIRIYDRSVRTNDLSRALAENRVEMEAIGRHSESLEDYFLKLTEGEGTACFIRKFSWFPFFLRSTGLRQGTYEENVENREAFGLHGSGMRICCAFRENMIRVFGDLTGRDWKLGIVFLP